MDTTHVDLCTLFGTQQHPRLPAPIPGYPGISRRISSLPVPTRQTSSSGRPKSPRIQVVLPEDLCDRLALLAEAESRTVSNMARVLIQQGVERLERQRFDQVGPEAAGAAGVGGLRTDRFRAALERQQQAAPRRLRGAPRRLRLRRPIG